MSHCRAEVGRVTSWCPRKLRISQPCNSPHPQRFGDLGSQSPFAIRSPGFCSEALDAFYSRVVLRPSLMDSGALLYAQLNLPQAATTQKHHPCFMKG